MSINKIDSIKGYITQFCLSNYCGYQSYSANFWLLKPITNEEAKVFAVGLELIGWYVSKESALGLAFRELTLQIIPIRLPNGQIDHMISLRHNCWESSK